MLTPAEELLAAVKEHATARDEFGFEPSCRFSVVSEDGAVYASVHYHGGWIETCGAVFATHDSASSAVYSAFLRARGKQI